MFSELGNDEKVMTLNAEIGEKEWQLPIEYQEFEHDKEMYKIVLEDENGEESELVVSEEHKVYAGEENKIKKNNLSSKGFIMVAEEKENNGFVLFINPEFENETFHNMDSPFTSEVIGKRLVVIRVDDNFSDFVFNNLSQEWILFAGFINSSFASLFNNRSIGHFSSNISEAELNLINLPSFNTLFISSTCSGLGGNSSTGCQSICSQNSQSSSVTSPVCLYLLDMSCFKTSINAFPSNLDATLDWSSLGNCIFNSAILTDNIENHDYLSFSIEKNLSNFKLQKITKTYQDFNESVYEDLGEYKLG